jgi:hypothetical protein
MTWTTIVRRTLPMADSGNIQLGAVGGVAGGQPTLMKSSVAGSPPVDFSSWTEGVGHQMPLAKTIKRLAPG